MSTERRTINGLTFHHVLCGLTVAALFTAIPHASAIAEDMPKPEALLRGVEKSRMEVTSLRANLRIQFAAKPKPIVTECLVEMDGENLRWEVFAGDVKGQVILRQGDDFTGFRRTEHEDVNLYDLKTASGVRGDLAFDPRILGLMDLIACDAPVRSCLWYHNGSKLSLEGKESLRGVSVWKVKAVRDGKDVATYWIEEPGFRVHRRTVESDSLFIEIDSYFDATKASSPFPSRVLTKRTIQGKKSEDRNYIIENFEVGADVPADRFSMASMDLPINTPVVDYRIKRIIGYWDGKGLSLEPVQQ